MTASIPQSGPDGKNESSDVTKSQTTNPDPAARAAQADLIIRRNVLWALGAGAVPVPVLDVAAVTAVELKMLKQLSEVYGLEFSSGMAKKIIYSLLSSVGIVGVGSLIGGSLAKLVPVFGPTLGFVSVPVLSGAFTHGVGHALVMHFETGGTLLDFDPVAMRAYFKQEFEKAKDIVKQMQSESAKDKSKVS